MAHSNSQPEVFLFYSEGEADGSDPEYQRGNRHALLVFLRQDRDTEPDFETAQGVAEANGWVNVVIEEAAAINVSTLSDVEEVVQEAYYSALQEGYHVIRFSDPVEPE